MNVLLGATAGLWSPVVGALLLWSIVSVARDVRGVRRELELLNSNRARASSFQTSTGPLDLR